MRKKICFIATGGTIASSNQGNGFMPSMAAESLISAVPQLAAMCDIDFLQLLQLDSSNLVPQHWQKMAMAVISRYDDYDGFVISHGTDTMAYTAAALYYMLVNIGKPVVLTGSQLPMENPKTDAKGNLLTAFHTAVSGCPGVFLAFSSHVILGNAAKKMYSQEMRAFWSINQPEAAFWDGEKLIWNEIPLPAGPFHPIIDLDDRVMTLKLVPGTKPELLKMLADMGYKGIVLETFGAGGVPTDESPLSLLPAIDYAIRKGVTLVCTTQCTYDGVHLDTYEVGVRALQHGVLSGHRQTVEALVAKLMLALAASDDPQVIAQMMK